MQVAKKRRDLLSRFEEIYQKVKPKVDNPLRKFSSLQKLRERWNKLPDERLVGFLHAYLLLKPHLKKAFKSLNHL